MVETGEYAELMVYLELYGRAKGAYWCITADKMGFHDHIALLLRKLKVSYRTHKEKKRAKTTFSVYFERFSVTPSDFRPFVSTTQRRFLDVWREHTEKVYTDKYITIEPEQRDTIKWILDKIGSPIRVIDRMVAWKGAIRPGWVIHTDPTPVLCSSSK